jgi:bifunctional non-homologous end joining protein LigD
MSLEDYRRKRDFTKSPEPTGEAKGAKKASKAAPLFFCVQKHLASHLHYDFRLEHHGVLLSWAVPKGPSLDPTVKRLAMHVEDHPYDYGTFEGVIPEGYGAGIVMLWDTGTWTPLSEDVDAALAKGDLKFSLDGYKLKGSWALVRTRGYGGSKGEGRSWLLIKHKDDWSGDLDITTFASLSVKSNQDFADILADDNPDIWRTNRPVSGGETGALLRDIIEQAAARKAARKAGRTPSANTAARAPGTGRAAKKTVKKKAVNVKRKTAGAARKTR